MSWAKRIGGIRSYAGNRTRGRRGDNIPTIGGPPAGKFINRFEFESVATFGGGSGTPDETSIRSSRGAFCLNKTTGNSLFISGWGGQATGPYPQRAHDKGHIAEFHFPPAGFRQEMTNDFGVIPQCQPRDQEFVTMADKGGTTGQLLDTHESLYFYDSGGGTDQIFQMAMIKYDGNTYDRNLLIIRDASDLANCTKDGWHSLGGFDGSTPQLSPRRLSGWMSDIPSGHVAGLGGDLIVGNASGDSIIGSLSVGPSAWSCDKADIIAAGNTRENITATELMNYEATSQMVGGIDSNVRVGLTVEHLTNGGVVSAPNDFEAMMFTTPNAAANIGKSRSYLGTDAPNPWIWNHICHAGFGFVLSDTYVVFGQAAGFIDGVYYQAAHKPNTSSDARAYYWAYDVQDLKDVKSGSKQAHQVVPYEHGELPQWQFTPFWRKFRIRDGDYDATNKKLYLTWQNAYEQYSVPAVTVHTVDDGAGVG